MRKCGTETVESGVRLDAPVPPDGLGVSEAVSERSGNVFGKEF